MINILDFIPKKDNYFLKGNFKNGVRSCDIGLTRYYGNNPLSEFVKNKIQSVTGGIFNHAFFVGKEADIIEAEANGIKKNKLEKYVKNEDGVLIFRLKHLPDNLKSMMLSFAYAQIGKKYDYKGLLSFVLPFLRQEENSYYCSEFVWDIYNIIGIKICEKKDGRVSPADLFYALKNSNKFFIADYKNLDINRII